jgi:hypothetical protein
MTPLSLFDLGSAIASTLLAFYVALAGYSAYRYTGRRYLLNFFAGFILLGVSFAILALLLQPTGSLTVNPGLEWVRHLVQLGGFLLIASSYVTKIRRGETALLVLFTFGVLAAVGFTLAVPGSAPRTSVADELVFLANALLALYVVNQVIGAAPGAGKFHSGLVVYGFGILAVSQYTWLIWSFDGGSLAFALAEALRLVGLAMLVLVVIPSEKQKG